MGRLVIHQWGRLLALAASTYMLWASLWAFFYRKFFWDMIGGTLGPGGIIPGANTRPLVAIVVGIPLLQSFTLVLSLGALLLEYPIPWIEGTSIHRSFVFRAVYYFIAGFIGIMVYQTVDCAIYMIITSAVYTAAIVRAEVMPLSKDGIEGAAC